MLIKGVVQPECIAQILCVLTCSPLLPVKPPEVYTNLLKWREYGVKIGIRPLLLVNLKWYALALLSPAVSLCKSLVWLLKWLNT